MEAITEANREETIVRKFIFPSSVSVYGSDLTGPATEEHPVHPLSSYAISKLGGHTRVPSSRLTRYGAISANGRM